MSAVAVAADSSRYDSMDALTNVVSIGGGAGAGLEPDIFYQGAGAISRKITAAGFSTSTGTNRNMTSTARTTWLVKVWITNFAALNSTGLEVRVGSTSGGASNYYLYRLASSTAGELYKSVGGFIIEAIDPNVSAHRTSTNGSPSLTAVAAFATVGNTTSASRAENLVLDAIDVGIGLYLTGGDGGDADGDFDDFITADEGTVSTGRFGYVLTQDGILFVRGRLIFGATSSSGTRTATATVFTDTGKVVVFPDNLADVGFSGLVVDLGNASNTITWTGCSFLGRGIVSPDTRPVLEVFGTTATTGLVATNCTFNNFGTWTLTSKCNFTGCTAVDIQTITHAGATLTSCTFDGHPTAASAALISTADLSAITYCAFDNTGGTGHAIVLSATGTYSFVGNTFTGYGADASTSAAIFNDSGGLVTLNVSSGGSTPTIRNGSGASTVVNNNISVTLTGLKDNTEVRVYTTGTTTELAGIEDATAGTVDARTFTFTLSAGTDVDIRIHNVQYEVETLLAYEVPTSDTSVPIQQRFDRNYLNQ